jgi:hypothetical protein
MTVLTPILKRPRANCLKLHGRIDIEKINVPFLFRDGGSPAEYRAGLAFALAKGWLWKHESGTYVKFTQAGADLFA